MLLRALHPLFMRLWLYIVIIARFACYAGNYKFIFLIACMVFIFCLSCSILLIKINIMVYYYLVQVDFGQILVIASNPSEADKKLKEAGIYNYEIIKTIENIL